MLLNSLLANEAKWYPVLFDSPINVVRGVTFWLTIALALVFVICALRIQGEARAKFLKGSLFFITAYACAVGIVFLSLTFAEDGIVKILFAPLLILLAAIAASAIVLCFNRKKPAIIATLCVVAAAFIAVLVCTGIYYGKNIADDGYYNSDIASVNQIVLYISATALILVAVALSILFGKNDKKGFDSKSISYAAICVAMSFALSYLRLVKLPQGGSVTLASLLPIMIYSYMFGTKKGVFVGFIYGLLQAIQDPYIIHPAQFVLDYPAAFACIGLAGAFAKVKAFEKAPQVKFALGAVLASAFRFISHVLSGVFAFSAYAKGANPWAYSLAYNSFVFVDIAIVIVVGVIVFSSKAFVKQTEKFNKEVPSEK